MFRLMNPRGRVLCPVLAFAMLAALDRADAAGFKQLYGFTGGADGAAPYGALIADDAGNLYGTTSAGGAYGYGTVFRIAPGGTETVLYAFTGQADGGTPYAGLVADSQGNLYGTTWAGGDLNCGSDSGYFMGCGTVFKVAPDGSETVLYAFEGGSDGDNPDSTPIIDGAGNLFGTTANGGAQNGTVFRNSPAGTETQLYVFKGYPGDGAGPHAGLVADKQGNLYGTTVGGGDGCPPAGCGTVFKLAPDGTVTILYAFAGGSDGSDPFAGLFAGKHGDFYGTTELGGAGTGCPGGCGTVFNVTPTGEETVLHSFTGGSDGAVPQSVPIADKQGNLYGTTVQGGSANVGTVFKLAPNGTETILVSFSPSGSYGASPYGSLIMDDKGNLYGTATLGGTGDCLSGCGTVFEITADDTLKVLHEFTGGTDGAYPEAGLIRDKEGNFYGTTANGGNTDCGGIGCGAVIKMTPDGKITTLYSFTGGTDGAQPYAPVIADKHGNLFGTTSYDGMSCTDYALKGCGTVFEVTK